MREEKRAGAVLRIILLEGCANLVILVLKIVVGVATGSMAILADAVHSLTDVANNAIALLVMRASNQPADREHPYGHKKFEILAVFVLAVLLATVALEIAVRALSRSAEQPDVSAWALAVMIGVLVINVALALWQRYWARRLDSPILRADASHTLSDVLTTIVVIIGWQLSARGLPWLDTACALGVSLIILYLAFGLFRNAVPVLVDAVAIEPEALSSSVSQVRGVRDVRRVRSRWIGTDRSVDIVVAVSPTLTTLQSHAIADEIERALAAEFGVRDVTVHVEPDV
ncbi:MAG: cation diffusion facilitator family transporter [Pseudomonadota bacterium]